jgi:hypothetical protein
MSKDTGLQQDDRVEGATPLLKDEQSRQTEQFLGIPFRVSLGMIMEETNATPAAWPV